MARTAAAKLTSKERCRKAFTDWYLTPGVTPPEHVWQMGENAMLQFNAWYACWRYLESRVTDYIEK